MRVIIKQITMRMSEDISSRTKMRARTGAHHNEW
ncbi:hypothetical protein MPC4_10158 [Methylocella tundrae]|uniref:Uncharacterized protein n=1 Tax=Methylocella tundrae TaxID=227605 RepID=A0A8B6M073_METTU|nr:hypothetical protein MPC4_10158 [Methylocella tundrae]